MSDVTNSGQYQQGVSGNPGGRPKGSSILAPWLRLLAADPDLETGEGARACNLANVLLESLESGEPARAKIILEALKITDPQVKEINVTSMERGGAVPLDDEGDEPE